MNVLTHGSISNIVIRSYARYLERNPIFFSSSLTSYLSQLCELLTDKFKHHRVSSSIKLNETSSKKKKKKSKRYVIITHHHLSCSFQDQFYHHDLQKEKKEKKNLFLIHLPTSKNKIHRTKPSMYVYKHIHSSKSFPSPPPHPPKNQRTPFLPFPPMAKTLPILNSVPYHFVDHFLPFFCGGGGG